MTKIFAILPWHALLFLSMPAAAQNLAGVFPPNVVDGHASWQYRAAYDQSRNRHAQRVHYQQSINDDLMWRLVGQARKTVDSDLDFDFFQAELFWELSDNSSPWRQGLRFDLRVRDEGRPGLLGVHWTNHLQLDERTRLRFLVMSLADVGDGSRKGVVVQTRADVAYRLDSGVEVGLEMYNNYGSTRDFGGFNDQSHQLGPVVSVPAGRGWSLLAGVLLGMSDGAPDQDYRLWITRSH